jgi:hypothetical protein
VVHANAPYGCAFFDAHMSQEEVDRRYAATLRAREEAAATGELYYRVWLHLCHKGLIGRLGDRAALNDDRAAIGRRVQRRNSPS